MSDGNPPTGYLQRVLDMYRRAAYTNAVPAEGEDVMPSPENDAPWNVVQSVTYRRPAEDEWGRERIPCPDGKPGCLVLHYRKKGNGPVHTFQKGPKTW